MKGKSTGSTRVRPAKKTSTRKSDANDFTDDEVVRESQQATQSSGNYIRVKEGEKAPIYFLSSKFEQGYEHWIDIGGSPNRIPCAGGMKGKGYAADDCPLCALAQEHFNSAKKLASAGKSSAAKAEKDLAFKIRAKYAMYFIAAKGERNVVSVKGEKQFKIEFDNAQVGLLSLTKANRDAFAACKAKYDYIVQNKDLFNRYIIFDKRKRGEDEFSSVEFIPAKKPSEKPDVEIPEDVDLDSVFEVDMAQIKKVAKAFRAGDFEEEDDSNVDLEDEDEEDEDSLEELDSDDDDSEEEDEDSEEEEEDEEEEPTPRKQAKSKKKPPVKKHSKSRDVEEEEDSDEEEVEDEDFADVEEDEDGDEESEEEGDDEDFLGKITDDFEDDDPEETPKKRKTREEKTTKKVIGKKPGPVSGFKNRGPAKEAPEKRRGRPTKSTPPLPAKAKAILKAKHRG